MTLTASPRSEQQEGPSRQRSPARWWEAVELEPGTAARWRIGGLELVVARRAREWLVHEARVEEPEEPDWSFEHLPDWDGEDAAAGRHVFRQTAPRVRAGPILADRAIVTSPRIPLHVPPDEETTLYVGSPLWAGIETGDPPQLLHETAIRRPSDTWFGPNTREGELCYAIRTRAAVDLANVPRTSRRAITALRIRNRASTALHVEKVKLPVPFLSVFHSPETELLWTEAVLVVQREEGAEAEVEIRKAPPAEAGGTERLAAARQQPEKGLLVRAFGSLFQ